MWGREVEVTSHLVSFGVSYWIYKTFGLDNLKLSCSVSLKIPSFQEKRIEEMKGGQIMVKIMLCWIWGSQILKLFLIAYVLSCCLVLLKWLVHPSFN